MSQQAITVLASFQWSDFWTPRPTRNPFLDSFQGEFVNVSTVSSQLIVICWADTSREHSRWSYTSEDMTWYDLSQKKICGNHSWLVVYLPLWKIWKSVGMIIPLYGKINNVPNHQPDSLFLLILLRIALRSPSEVWAVCVMAALTLP